MKNLFANPWTFGRWRWWRHALNPMNTVRGIRWSLQRARRGYADCDVWGFDSYLAGLIVGGLGHMNDNLCGTPMLRDGSTEADGYTPKALGVEEWHAEIRKMIDGFRAHLAITEMDWPDDIEADKAKWDAWVEEKNRVRADGFAAFTEWYGHLWT